MPDCTTTARWVTLLMTALSDDVDDAALGRDGHIGDSRRRHSEIQNSVGPFRDFPEVSGQLDAVLGKTRKHAGILADKFRSRRLKRTVDDAAGGF